MTVEIIPEMLKGELSAPSSKSICHRILCAALLSDSDTRIYLNCFSDDILATCRCVSELGKKVEINKNGGYIDVLNSKKVSLEKKILDAGESGTTARFMLSLASVLCDEVVLTGRGRLVERPFSALCEQLKSGGVSIDSDSLPMNCKGRLKSGIFYISGNISTQYISGLLFALSVVCGDSEIRVTTRIEGFPYIQMTIDVMKMFGVNVKFENNVFYVKGNSKYISPGVVHSEADWSNAAFFIVANHIGCDVLINNLEMNSSQGDKRIMSLCENIKDTDVSDIPDLVPILSVLYATSGRDVKIYNAGRLRLKESDRISTTCAMLRGLGGEVEEKKDEIIIHGKDYLTGGICDSFNDHRIAMAAAIASVKCKHKVIIKNAEAVNKSYPKFFEDFASLGGKFNVI